MNIEKKDILDIIERVGGKENISLLTHCVTRLRFVLKDESKIDEKGLKENPLVKGCFSVKGQYQVIIGPGLVDQVYDLVLDETGAKEADSSELKEVENKSMNPLQRALKLFSDVFYPILPAIVGAGLLPCFGVHHANKLNQFNLADDMIEPLRPFVDYQVNTLNLEGVTELNTSIKNDLLKILTQNCIMANEEINLLKSCELMAVSLVKSIKNKDVKFLELPKLKKIPLFE